MTSKRLKRCDFSVLTFITNCISKKFQMEVIDINNEYNNSSNNSNYNKSSHCYDHNSNKDRDNDNDFMIVVVVVIEKIL